jgi:hypothetical protein
MKRKHLIKVFRMCFVLENNFKYVQMVSFRAFIYIYLIYFNTYGGNIYIKDDMNDHSLLNTETRFRKLWCHEH